MPEIFRASKDPVKAIQEIEKKLNTIDRLLLEKPGQGITDDTRGEVGAQRVDIEDDVAVLKVKTKDGWQTIGGSSTGLKELAEADISDLQDYALATHTHAQLHTQGTDTALGTLSTKNPPIDADKIIYRDSTATDALVTSTWTQVKAFLKSYFDTLYVALTGNQSVAGVKTFTDGIIVKSYERHVQIDAKPDGAVVNQPAEVDFFTAGGLQFNQTTAKYAFCQWEIPDDWDGGNVYFEVDWFPDSGAISGTAAVRWTVEYRAIAEGEAINNGTSVTVDNGAGGDTGDYSQYITKHSRVTLPASTGNQPLTKQDHIYFKISRDVAVTNDFNGTVTVTAYEIIYNSVGIPTSN